MDNLSVIKNRITGEYWAAWKAGTTSGWTKDRDLALVIESAKVKRYIAKMVRDGRYFSKGNQIVEAA